MLLGVALLVPVVAGVGVAVLWSRVGVVNVPAVVAPVPADVVALVGSDRRSGVPSGQEAIFGNVDLVPGERADTVVLVSTLPDGTLRALGLPRDMLVPNERGEPERLSVRYERAGPAGLVQGVCQGVGVPVRTVVVVRFETVRALVDAAGGVEIDNRAALRDRTLGLELSAGQVRLDGPTALSYLRSRTLETRRDGVWEPDPVRSAARSERAALVASRVARELLAPSSVLRGIRALWDVAPSVVVSSGTGPIDLYRLGASLRGPAGAVVADLPLEARPGPLPALVPGPATEPALTEFLGARPSCSLAEAPS